MDATVPAFEGNEVAKSADKLSNATVPPSQEAKKSELADAKAEPKSSKKASRGDSAVKKSFSAKKPESAGKRLGSTRNSKDVQLKTSQESGVKKSLMTNSKLDDYKSE